MRRVVLIRTPIIQPEHHISSLRAVPSIGVAYLQAALKRSGLPVTLIDAAGEGLTYYRFIKGSRLTVNGLNAQEIISRIPADVGAIGVSCMHANEWIYDSFIIRQVALAFPHVPIFVGGENATGSFAKILKENPEVKAVVLGEGDIIAPRLASALLDKQDLKLIPGIAFIDENGKLKQTSRLLPAADPDQFLWPDWEGIPLHKYFAAKTSISVHNEKSITMLATRGCPHSCSFCTVPQMWKSKWHSRSPQDVVDEMRSYKEKYQINHVDFIDLTFALNKKWTKEFCEILIQENLQLEWSLPIGTRVEALDEEVLSLMRKAGCRRVLYSPESGSKITLARIRKKLKIKDMEDVIRFSVHEGIIVKLATIFGFPGQTKREVLGTFSFIFKAALIGVQDVVCLSFIPYPGTELHDQLVAEGELVPENEPVRLNNDIREMVSWSDSIPSFLMSAICLAGMALFYGTQFTVRPWRLITAFKNIFINRKPQTNFESIVYCALFRVSIKIEGEEDLSLNHEYTAKAQGLRQESSL